MPKRAVCAAIAVALACLAPALAKPVQHASAVRPDNGIHPALWTVHGPKGTAYLFGSVHVLPSGIEWNSQKLLAAMRRSDTFIFEVPLDHQYQDQVDAARLQQEIEDQHGLLPPGESLRKKLPSDVVPKYDAAIADLNISPGYVDRLQPWLVATVLETAQFFRTDASAMNGVDVQVYAIASGMHKETRGFETLEQQLAILGPAEQRGGIHELERVIDQVATDSEKKEYDAMVGAWEHGDIAGIRKETDAGFANDPALRKAMLDDRTERWAQEMAPMLNEPGTYFITVGAAHLVGPKGLPTLLRNGGYKVEGPDQPSAAPALHSMMRKPAPKNAPKKK